MANTEREREFNRQLWKNLGKFFLVGIILNKSLQLISEKTNRPGFSLVGQIACCATVFIGLAINAFNKCTEAGRKMAFNEIRTAAREGAPKITRLEREAGFRITGNGNQVVIGGSTIKDDEHYESHRWRDNPRNRTGRDSSSLTRN